MPLKVRVLHLPIYADDDLCGPCSYEGEGDPEDFGCGPPGPPPVCGLLGVSLKRRFVDDRPRGGGVKLLTERADACKKAENGSKKT